MIPSIGLRVESKLSGKAVAYSGDKMPSGAMIRLAKAAHILVHEAIGEMTGHTSPSQAAEIG
jgi:ribonuclease BN (tRNA processing enzyme)